MTRGFTIALIGADGAGKTTVARRLEHELGLPVRYLYMGDSKDSSNVMLPTTRAVRALKRRRGATPDRAGPRDHAELAKPRPRNPAKRALKATKSGLRLANQLAEEWYRQGLAWRGARRGEIVVFDRHFFSDYHAYDVAGADLPLSRRIHGFFLSRVYPLPDLVIFLDAPPEVLFARKGEGTIEILRRRREEYLALAELTESFAVVDAARPLDEVTAQVVSLVRSFSATRRLDRTTAGSEA
ncbi:MAG: hypothetical protein U0R69_13025 [Gaiellales bacterium]